MTVFEIKHVTNHKERTNFNMTNRFYNFQFYFWSLFFRNWNEYGNILAAEFDVNKGSSHLVAPSVSLNLRNILLYLKVFLIFSFALVWK